MSDDRMGRLPNFVSNGSVAETPNVLFDRREDGTLRDVSDGRMDLSVVSHGRWGVPPSIVSDGRVVGPLSVSSDGKKVTLAFYMEFPL